MRAAYKFSFGVIIALFLIIRAVYFILYPIGIIDRYPVTSYVFFEFPTFLFMIMNSVIIFLWVEIAYTVKFLHASPTVNKILVLSLFAWNTYIFACFIIYVVVYYTVTTDTGELPCNLLYFQLTQSSATINISKAYVVFVSSICFILALSMLISGLKLLVPHISLAKTNNAKLNFLLRTWAVMCIFTICFIVKSILLLVAAYTNFIVPILLFSLLEQIPTLVLLFYLSPHISDKLKITTLTLRSKTKSTSDKRSQTGTSSDTHIHSGPTSPRSIR